MCCVHAVALNSRLCCIYEQRADQLDTADTPNAAALAATTLATAEIAVAAAALATAVAAVMLAQHQQ